MRFFSWWFVAVGLGGACFLWYFCQPPGPAFRVERWLVRVRALLCLHANLCFAIESMEDVDGPIRKGTAGVRGPGRGVLRVRAVRLPVPARQHGGREQDAVGPPHPGLDRGVQPGPL